MNTNERKSVKVNISKKEYFIILSEANADELTLSDYIKKKIGIEFSELNQVIKEEVKSMPIGELFSYKDIKVEELSTKDRLVEAKLLKNYIHNSYFATETKDKGVYMRYI